MKTLSPEILDLIEDIVVQYNLEENLTIDDPKLKEKLSSAKTLQERRVFKFLYSKKFKEYIQSKKPLEEISAFIKLKKIIESLINKKLSFGDAKNKIKEVLPNQSSAEEISSSIINNPLISYSYAQEEEKEEKSNPVSPINKSGISQDLI